jgi:hypothetical protein
MWTSPNFNVTRVPEPVSRIIEPPGVVMIGNADIINLGQFFEGIDRIDRFDNQHK